MLKDSRLFSGLVVLMLVFIAAGCSSGNEPAAQGVVTVSFDPAYLDAPALSAITLEKGAAAGSQWPADPLRLGYTFGGWYAGTKLYTAQTNIGSTVTVTAQWSPEVSGLADQPSAAETAALFDTANGFPASLSNSWKIWGQHNALYTQAFGADPTVMVYNDRAYLFASNDTLLYDASGQVQQITYGTGIQGIHAASSADLANWTDHGVINVAGPATTNPLIDPGTPLVNFATASWAPSAAWKTLNGKPQFFVYYANSGNGIGVIQSDSPTGPWRSPLHKLLIDRNTPNCSSVANLFDPGVMVDADGWPYLFFGGGDGTNYDNTGMARRVRLGYDMVTLSGTPETWYVPYLFEDNEITNINGKYYYSYCANWNTGGNKFGLQNAQIAYMTASDPMGQFSDPKGIMAMPSNQLGSSDNNNHHCIFQFKGQTYIAYHASKVAEAMGLGFRYRSPFIDKVSMGADGSINTIQMTRKGVDQVGNLNPYVPNEAETIGCQGGIYTRPDAGASNGMVVTSIDTGDWIGVYGVDFGSAGATKFIARVRMPDTPVDFTGAIELRIDPVADGATGDTANLTGSNTTRIKGGTVIGHVYLKAKPGEAGNYTTVTVDLDQSVTGVHNLAFVFYSSLGVHPETVNPDSRHKTGFEFDQWQFFE